MKRTPFVRIDGRLRRRTEVSPVTLEEIEKAFVDAASERQARRDADLYRDRLQFLERRCCAIRLQHPAVPEVDKLCRAVLAVVSGEFTGLHGVTRHSSTSDIDPFKRWGF